MVRFRRVRSLRSARSRPRAKAGTNDERPDRGVRDDSAHLSECILRGHRVRAARCASSPVGDRGYREPIRAGGAARNERTDSHARWSTVGHHCLHVCSRCRHQARGRQLALPGVRVPGRTDVACRRRGVRIVVAGGHLLAPGDWGDGAEVVGDIASGTRREDHRPAFTCICPAVPPILILGQSHRQRSRRQDRGGAGRECGRRRARRRHHSAFGRVLHSGGCSRTRAAHADHWRNRAPDSDCRSDHGARAQTYVCRGGCGSVRSAGRGPAVGPLAGPAAPGS